MKHKYQLSLLMKNGKMDTGAKDDRGLNILHYACLMEDIDLINNYLKLGGNINAQDYSGSTALHYAVTLGNMNIVELLLSHNANPVIKNTKNDRLMLPIEEALLHGYSEKYSNIIVALIKATFLFQELSYDIYNVAKMILRYAVRYTDEKIMEEINPYITYIDKIAVCKSGTSAELKFLFHYFGWDCKDSDKDEFMRNTKCALLRSASENGEIDKVNFLISIGVDVNSPTESSKDTALHYAVQSGHLDIIKALVNGGANVKAVNIYDQSPLSIAIEEDEENFDVDYDIYPKIIGFLKEHGA